MRALATDIESTTATEFNTGAVELELLLPLLLGSDCVETFKLTPQALIVDSSAFRLQPRASTVMLLMVSAPADPLHLNTTDVLLSCPVAGHVSPPRNSIPV